MHYLGDSRRNGARGPAMASNKRLSSMTAIWRAIRARVPARGAAPRDRPDAVVEFNDSVVRRLPGRRALRAAGVPIEFPRALTARWSSALAAGRSVLLDALSASTRMFGGRARSPDPRLPAGPADALAAQLD